MAYDGTNFAGSTVSVDTEDVGKITSWTDTTTVNAENVSGSSDTVGTAPNKIIKNKQRPTSVEKTANVEGIYVPDNTGQKDLKTAAEAGTEVTLKQTDQNGYGEELTGFFTNFERTGELEGVYTFSAQFYSNDETEVAPSSP